MAQLEPVHTEATVHLSVRGVDVLPARRAVKKALSALKEANRELAKLDETTAALEAQLTPYGIRLELEEPSR